MKQIAAEKSVLIIDDEENMRHMLSIMLKNSGFDITTAVDGVEGLEKIKQKPFDFILCDVKMPNLDGMEFLKHAQGKLGTTTVIMMSAYGTMDLAINAMKLGAYDFISKPFKSDEVKLAIKKALERESLRQENSQLKERIRKIEDNLNFGNMIGKSQLMQDVFALANKVAGFSTTVLITGESGTGKELVAKGIHHASPRKTASLVPVNCGGIPENLLESELFGHKKGAFTGADKDKKGLFEEADNGTIFLDEIGELPIPLQVKLLRVLQENEIRPVGDAKTRKVDVRVITATAKNLEEEVEMGRFRKDLYYRLNVMHIQLPPLRERTEDIPQLCSFFIKRINKQFGTSVEGVSPKAMSHFLKLPWPGNVRELENYIERAVVLSEGKTLAPDHFPYLQNENGIPEFTDDEFKGYSLKAARRSLEKIYIKRALLKTNGNRTQASKMLEISHPSLLSKMKTYGIQ